MKFTTGEIISAGTGRLCCDMGGVYKIMNFLTGDNLFTHQLPRAFRVCQGWVKEQCPWLNELNEADCTTENWKQWLADAVAKYGDEHELSPMPNFTWLPMDPLSELEGMIGKDKIVTIQSPAV